MLKTDNQSCKEANSMKPGKYFEQLETGAHYESDGMTITEEAIIRFALEWDPQPFHVDVVRAKESLFGGLVAAGLHTIVMTYRLFNEMHILKGTALAGLGYRDIRFRKPVHPSDTLRVSASIVELAEARRSDCGIVTFQLETFNQDDINVLSLKIMIMVARQSTESVVDTP
jgi:acyl dehydratase